MQTLDIDRPNMPDLQFTLLVTALCTSRLTSLNVPEAVRTTMFNRCWTLIHDSPPPGRQEERVLDLRPWNEVTLDAMVETIRSVLSEAGIRTLAWDHPPSEPTRTSTPEAQPLIERLNQLYPQLSEASDAVMEEPLGGSPNLDTHRPDIWQLLGKLAALMATFSPALERRAADLTASGKDGELVEKLLKGADVMRDSGNMYLAWARHYAGLPEDHPNVAADGDESTQ